MTKKNIKKDLIMAPMPVLIIHDGLSIKNKS